MGDASGSRRSPLVTIGMPIYNGERYLSQALESLLDQTLGDFEILIQDNGSTDGTEEIARRFESKDARVKYSRWPENVGAVRNFNEVIKKATGEFFVFASDHDLHGKEFLELLVAALRREPAAVLAFCAVKEIDETGTELGERFEDVRTKGLRPASRPPRIIRNGGLHTAIYGLFRTDALRRSSGYQRTFGPDLCLLVELSLAGEFVGIGETLFFFRMFQQGPKVEGRRDWRAYLKYHLHTLEPGLENEWLPSHAPSVMMLATIMRTVLPKVSVASRCLLAPRIFIAWLIRWKYMLLQDAGLQIVLKCGRRLRKQLLGR